MRQIIEEKWNIQFSDPVADVTEVVLLLLQRWNYWLKTSGVRASSFSLDRLQHASVKAILAIGTDAVPVLLAQFLAADGCDKWVIMDCLECLIKKSPIREENRGRYEKSQEDWLNWAKTNGHHNMMVDVLLKQWFLTEEKSDIFADLEVSEILRSPYTKGIMKLGYDAIPGLFLSINQSCDNADMLRMLMAAHLLDAIVPEAQFSGGRPSFSFTKNFWLAWGKEHGYIDRIVD